MGRKIKISSLIYEINKRNEVPAKKEANKNPEKPIENNSNKNQNANTATPQPLSRKQQSIVNRRIARASALQNEEILSRLSILITKWRFAYEMVLKERTYSPYERKLNYRRWDDLEREITRIIDSNPKILPGFNIRLEKQEVEESVAISAMEEHDHIFGQRATWDRVVSNSSSSKNRIYGL